MTNIRKYLAPIVIGVTAITLTACGSGTPTQQACGLLADQFAALNDVNSHPKSMQDVRAVYMQGGTAYGDARAAAPATLETVFANLMAAHAETVIAISKPANQLTSMEMSHRIVAIGAEDDAKAQARLACSRLGVEMQDPGQGGVGMLPGETF
jgi:hypothetical protein